MSKFARFAFSSAENFDEAATRQAFAHAVPLKTVVIFCYDPRAAEVPEHVAEYFDQNYPGEIVQDSEGHKVASTTNIFPVIVAGGRAIDAFRSVAVAQHLFGIDNIVIVHHSHCGATSFTANGIITAFRDEQRSNIEQAFPIEALCIGDYEQSIASDVALIREQPGTPKSANIFGFFFDIDAGTLSLVASAPGVPTVAAAG